MTLLEVAEAQQRIFDALKPIGIEWVPINDAHGRVLAEDLKALRTQPPAAMSAMDGYAVRASDVVVGAPLRVIGESAAGHPFAGEMSPGHAVRIFTGAVIPVGADAILIQENTERRDDLMVPTETVAEGAFVRPAGLDFKAGWVGLEAGCVLSPLAIGLAASLGHAFVPVRRRPNVALIATGDELCWPGSMPGAGEIISSNTPALAAMVRAWGGDVVDLGIVPDRAAPLRTALEDARHADLIVTTGGASVGELDLVQDVATGAGMALDFWKIRMRPGKPLIFGNIFDRPFLGLPGNPVSAGVCAIVFLRGSIQRMLGLSTQLPITRATLGKPLGPGVERLDFARGRWIDKGSRTVEALDRQDSSMFAAFAHADNLLIRPPSDPSRQAGESIEIIDLAMIFRSLA